MSISKERQAILAREHYDRNKAAIKARARAFNKKRVIDIRAFLHDLKEGTPCLDCGLVFDPVCMDFDHVRGAKRFNISDAKNWSSLAKVKSELEKCELVCSNCHRLRTKNRLSQPEVAELVQAVDS